MVISSAIGPRRYTQSSRFREDLGGFRSRVLVLAGEAQSGGRAGAQASERASTRTGRIQWKENNPMGGTGVCWKAPADAHQYVLLIFLSYAFVAAQGQAGAMAGAERASEHRNNPMEGYPI